MKILIVYSTLTNNTKMVAESMLTALPEGAACFEVGQAPEPEGYDLVMPGFWVDKGRADAAMRAYFQKIKNRKVAFFFTLGAYPDSAHADEVATATTAELEGNQILGHFRCQGKVDPKLLERMAKMDLGSGNPHAMTPERQARLDEAAKHPNETDFEKARAFAREMVARLA